MQEDLENEPITQVAGLKAEETKFAVAKRVIKGMRLQLDALERLLDAETGAAETGELFKRVASLEGEYLAPGMQERIVEGVFDGEHMIGEDGQKYLVPPNYASKSKLVEGDLMRLTINDRGRFIFKQKGPIERQRYVGMLTKDEQDESWKVMCNGCKYQILGASVSFYKGDPGDDVVILVPRSAPSRWAAVENIVKKGAESQTW